MGHVLTCEEGRVAVMAAADDGAVGDEADDAEGQARQRHDRLDRGHACLTTTPRRWLVRHKGAMAISRESWRTW